MLEPSEPPSRQDAGARRALPGQWLAFLGLSALLTAVFFWPAIVGRSILVPLDIAPNLFPKYRYVDPAATGVPANHYAIDLILGDVSRNLLVHEAWRRGEMPWWDPYTDGGKPLGAEANLVNISDPFKVLLFHALPFEKAYNAFRIVPFFLSGVTAFLLLRHFGFGFAPSTWGGLLYEFAGCNFVWFGSPTFQSTFVYYPLLWVLWDRAVQRRRWGWFGVSALATALIFLSGNMQSHSYLFLFTTAFLIGYGWKRRDRWGLLLGGVAGALLMGVCLAAPFVLPQVELFFLSARKVQPAGDPMNFLSGLASISAVFPWVLGTFRTLDLSKFFGQPILGFTIYVGSAALIIAAIGAAHPARDDGRDRDLKRTALALIVAYVLVCSTPLLFVMYTRTAWLAILGLIVLFARGWRFLSENETTRLKSFARSLLVGTVALAAAIHFGVEVIYPRIQAKVEARFLAAQKANSSLGEGEPLRRFQVRSLASEVTFRNPETVLAFAGMIALGLFLLRPSPFRALALNGILVLSTLPLLAFGHRFIPVPPLKTWEKIRTGGPEQQRVVQKVQGHLRLLESAPGSYDCVFPGAMAQLFKVHTLNGYTSLVLNHALLIDSTSGPIPESYYDYEYRSPTQGLERGELVPAAHTELSRFRWSDRGAGRRITVDEETSTRLGLTIEAGAPGDLIRAETFYPGWRAFSETGELKVSFEPPCFSRIQVPAETTHVRFVFQPRFWRLGLWIAAAASLVLGGSLLLGFTRKTAR